MNVQQAIPIFERQKTIGKTGPDRVLHPSGLAAIEAAMADVNNQEVQVLQCAGCGFVFSMALSINGCPNCGVDDTTTEINA